jgi:formylglycine-generating enzyme required for sulfatase activity
MSIDIATIALASVASKKIIEALAIKVMEKVTENITEQAIEKNDQLLKMLFAKLGGNQAAKEALLKANASGAEEDMRAWTTYLDMAVKDDENFAEEAQSLAEEIISLVQEENHPIDSSQTRSPKLPIKTNKSIIHTYTETLSPGVEMEMALILGGEFQMGSPEEEEYRQSDEKLHTVTVPTFFMGCTPVTQGQWKAIVQLSQISTDLKPNPSNFKGDDNLPVEKVSWDDAIEFCRLLSIKTGRIYRLPSESEWEYACRAGTTTPFSFGATIDAQLANYDSNYNYGKGVKSSYSEKTTPVKKFAPNSWGLYDMHDNVYEWCQDDYESDYRKAPSDGTPYSTQSDRKVLRGGSWFSLPWYCRSAYRSSDSRAYRNDFFGFRIVSSTSRTLA